MKFNHKNIRMLLAVFALLQIAVTSVEAAAAAARLAELRKSAKAASSADTRAAAKAAKTAAKEALLQKVRGIKGASPYHNLLQLGESRASNKALLKNSTGIYHEHGKVTNLTRVYGDHLTQTLNEQAILHKLLNSKHVTSADRINAVKHGIVKDPGKLRLTPEEIAAVEKSHKTAIKKNVFSQENLTNVFGAESASKYKNATLAKANAKAAALDAAAALKKADKILSTAMSVHGRGSDKYRDADTARRQALLMHNRLSNKYKAKKEKLTGLRAGMLAPAATADKAFSSEQLEAHAAMRNQAKAAGLKQGTSATSAGVLPPAAM